MSQVFEGAIGVSKGTWKEGVGMGSKKEGRCANIVDGLFASEALRPSIFLVHDAVHELFHELPAIHLVIVACSAAADLVRREEP